ncbi:MAG: hypothetical protein CMM58_02005 [Rhodospirillaceae bacterium]|nr:hypothetical protein [Rhodospirillaceae bacterium]
MPSKIYNELLIEYSDSNGFLHYANETEGATLQPGLTQRAAFEGFQSGDLEFIRFLNTTSNDHVFTSDQTEIEVLRADSQFAEEGAVFNLLSAEVTGSQAVHRFFNTDTGKHHYTADANEIESFGLDENYSSEGVVGYGGVVDGREAEQVASMSSTITLNQPFSARSFSGDGAFRFDLGESNFSSAGLEGVSVTAMSPSGTELPAYMGFNESNGQIYGYTLKEGLSPTTVAVVADDGTSQITSNFVISTGDGNSKSEADTFTEKSLAAMMAIETSSLGGAVFSTPSGRSGGDFFTAATAFDSTNLTAFQAANPSIDGTGTTIAVLDTGIDLDHPFFGPDSDGDGVSDNIVASQDFHGDGNGASDPDGHGTHVAGIAMSSDVTYPGVAPGAKVAAIQVLGADGGFRSSVEAGLQWVISNASSLNITAVNLSLGNGSNSNFAASAEMISDELSALRSMGIITFAAAGNSFAEYNTQGIGSPAIDPNAIAISALDSSNSSAASYSQRSESLTSVFAPGTFITNAAPGTGAAIQTLSGTSMATPYVAGVSSLIRQLNPNLSVADFEAFLAESASTFVDPVTAGSYRILDVNGLANLATGGTSPTPTSPTNPSTDDHADTVGTNSPVTAGVSVSGELETGGDKDVFSFSGSAGSSYTIDLRGAPSSLGTLSDPLLRVLDADGTSLAQDDDGGTGFESSMIYVPTTSGLFYIEAGAFSSSQTGTYQLDVADTSSQDDHPDIIGSNTNLSLGVAQTGEIEESGDVDVFALDVNSGTTYTIDQKAFYSSVGTLADPLLTLRDGSGNILAQDDDGGFRLESQITYTAESSTTLYLEAGAFGTRTGSYEISVGSNSTIGDVADVPGSGLTEISIGISQTGDLEVGGDKDVFSLSVNSGGTYQIDLRGSTSGVGTLTDPLLRVLDANSQVLAENDDGGSGFESSLNFTASSTGEVFLEAGAFSSSQTGTYQLDVSQTGVSTASLGDLIGQTAAHAPLASLGTIFGGAIDFDGDRDMYQFSLTAGSTYQFNIRGSHSSHGTLWDPQAFLYGENGELLAQDDDSGTGFDSSISYTAQDTGSYYLDVVANIGHLSHATGTYSVESVLSLA